jgi:predicted component of type VI protein secretion system
MESIFQLGKRLADPHFLTVAIFKFRNLKDGQATPVPTGEFTIGRADDSYIHIDDSSISRHHARLLNDEQGFFVEDLGSANGIALNGAYVKGRTKIKLGDLVHIGSIPFRIDPEVEGEASASLQPGLRRIDHDVIHKDTERVQLAPAAIATSEEPEKKKHTSSGSLIRQSVPLPTLVRLISPPSAEDAKPATVSAAHRAETSPAEEDNSEALFFRNAPWWWWMAIFLAGLGTGLLLALYFVKFFLDMGGRPSSLP